MNENKKEKLIVTEKTRIFLGLVDYQERGPEIDFRFKNWMLSGNDRTLYNMYVEKARMVLGTALRYPDRGIIDWERAGLYFDGLDISCLYDFLMTQFPESELVVVPMKAMHGRMSLLFGIEFPRGISQEKVRKAMNEKGIRIIPDEEKKLTSFLKQCPTEWRSDTEKHLNEKREDFARLEDAEWQYHFSLLSKPQLRQLPH